MSESVQKAKVEEWKEGEVPSSDPRVIGFLQSFGIYPKAVRKAVITIEAREDVKIECEWDLGMKAFWGNAAEEAAEKAADKERRLRGLREREEALRNEILELEAVLKGDSK